MSLQETIETLTVLGDESRIRLCTLLAGRELCVTDLVRVTGLSQSRVSTHLGRLREAGIVRDRRRGAQCFYALSTETLPLTAKGILEEASHSGDPTLQGDQKRLIELDAERRGGLPESISDEMERDYSPGRTWQSLAMGLAALLQLGDVLDVGSGDASAASVLAPYCRTLQCIDLNARLIEAAQERLAKHAHVRADVGDVHALPFEDASFDSVLVFHTLTYAERPEAVLKECARVLRPGGRIVVLCLDQHRHQEVTARYGERHPGFSPRQVRKLLEAAGLVVRSAEVACRESKKPHLQVVLAIGQLHHEVKPSGRSAPQPAPSPKSSRSKNRAR